MAPHTAKFIVSIKMAAINTRNDKFICKGSIEIHSEQFCGDAASVFYPFTYSTPI